MRVTFVLPEANLAGGIRVIAIYADRLQRRGHQVTVVSTPRRPYPMMGRIKDLLRGHSWQWRRGREPSHLDDIDVDHRVIESHRPIADRDVPDADVVIATWWETAEWVAALSPSKGAKVFFIQHYEAFSHQPIPRVEAVWRLPMHKIVIAQWLADLAKGKFDAKDVSLVPNAVELEQFHAPPRGKQPAPTVGVMYSPIAFKGCDISLKAFELARRNVPELRLVSFGAHQPTKLLPLPSGTQFTYRPEQSKIRQIYAACDAWLFASRSEGFGLPILEAMACRTPVIGTPVGAAPELLGAGGGALVRPEDPQDMAVAIERIAKMSDKEWQAMSQAAHGIATRYTWDDATIQFEAALRHAIDANQPLPSVAAAGTR